MILIGKWIGVDLGDHVGLLLPESLRKNFPERPSLNDKSASTIYYIEPLDR